MFTLSETEVTALNGILASDYMNGATGSDAIGREVWAWSANPFENKKVFSGACSKLKQKRFIRCNGNGASSTIAITKQGFKALQLASEPVKPAKAYKPAKPATVPSEPVKRGRKPARMGQEATKPVTAMVVADQPVQPARIDPRPVPGRVVTARKPRRVTVTVPAKTLQTESPKPVAKPAVAITLHGLLKLVWRDGIIVAETTAETEKAWRLVAVNNDGQNGIECWFPKSALENVENSTYKLADWFLQRYAHKSTFSWLWNAIR